MDIALANGFEAAVSRIGSGSHVMAGVHARAQGWPVADLKFEIVRNLAGARKALRDSRMQPLPITWQQRRCMHRPGA